MDVAWSTVWTASGVAGAALTLLAWWLVRRAKLLDERREKYEKALEAEEKAKQAHRDAVRNSTDPSEIAHLADKVDEARRECENLRKSLPVLLVLALALCGCASRKPAERIVFLDAHAKIVKPGDVVPEYPDGESRWWLVTPTGMSRMVPQYGRKDF